MSSTFRNRVVGLNAQLSGEFEEITAIIEKLIQLYSDEGLKYDPITELQEEMNTILKKFGGVQPELPEDSDYYVSSD